MKLPSEFLERMEKRLGEKFPAFLQSYEKPPVKGLRVNPLKISAEEFKKISPFPLTPVPWEENGFYLNAEKAGADPYHFAGLYYLQEPSAMYPARLLGVTPGEKVLDLCAAPGGKCTALAGELQGEGLLIANEYDYSRARILSENVERLGVKNCAVISAEPPKLSPQFVGFFDKILVDAPCSGEGMFKKEESALLHWSEGNVRGCALRQREILEHAATMLRAGGTLLYSTCTFSEEENEGQISSFLERHKEFSLLMQHYLYPHTVEGEGQFAALLVKKEGEEGAFKPFVRRADERAERACRAFLAEFLETPPEGELHVFEDGRVTLLPAGMPQLKASMLRLGVELGSFDGKLFKPAHALVTSLKGFKKTVRLSREECLPYLGGEQLAKETEDGWCAVTVEGYPLGLGKAVGGVIKNHFPKGLRKRL